ncbi:MAG: RagB/SusD family nutrient uptake outer membrane protein [Dysgonomonas sp.]|nr:RagB/SusD family nutrient uptake outer membrane protein [Dysgonomonas sp.]
MKNIYKLLVAVILLYTATSCSGDWLDTSPSDGLPKEEAITNLNDASNALTGVYDRLQGSSTYPSYYGARMIYYGDVRGDDMQAAGATKRTAPSYQMTYTVNSGAPQIWEVPYMVIRRANSLIKAIDNNSVTDATTEELDSIKGQALAIRALAHFDLARVYSKPYTIEGGSTLGIPVVLEPLAYDATPSRNTLEEVYTQVISDLKESIQKMTPTKSTGYFNQWAAKALLARVYLYKGDNANAFSTAVDIINNSPYKLWTNEEYEGAWAKSGTSEVIFEIVNASNDDWVDRESIGYLYAEEGYDDAIMTKKYVDMVESNYANDVRLTLMSKGKKTTNKWGTNKVYINKYPGREGTSDIRINNLPILRLSETYLIAAEAAAKSGDATNAAKYLNAIVKRGNPDATELTPAQATEDRILQERRIEFVGEGHRFFDLLRNNKDIVRYTTDADQGWHLPLTQESRSFSYDYFRAILPIPAAEISANPTIQQNPEY